MNHDAFLVPISDEGKQVVDLIKIDRHRASELMAALPHEEQVSLVSKHAARDPKGAQELLFLLEDAKSRTIVDDLGDRTLFRMMKSQSSTHIGMLSLLNPERVQSIIDLDQELFSTKGITDPDTAYYWMVSFLEEDETVFGELLRNINIKVVASAFQDKIVKPGMPKETGDEEDEDGVFPADFLVKLDRGELKPEDLEVTDEETLDILTKIYLTDEMYFNELVSIMLRDDEVKARAAEEAMERIQSNVGDLSKMTEEAEDMFVPLEE
jgi:hypothetical protein